MNSDIEIIVVDDDFDDEYPTVVLLREEFENVKVYKKSDEAKDYILHNLTKKFIVILDLNFPKGESTGSDILEKIRFITENIPIIIYTAKPDGELWGTFKNFIDEKVFAFCDKAADLDEIIGKVRDAAKMIQYQVASELEEWINIHSEEEKEKPYMISKDGTSHSLKQLLTEIRKQTPLGKEIEKDIVMLTIDLLARNKEKLRSR